MGASILFLTGFLIFILLKPRKFSKSQTILILTVLGIVVVSLLMNTDFKKANQDITRLFKNSGPHTNNEILTVLFKSNADSCTEIINLKDQVIPYIDCCIWIEMNTCKSELEKIFNSKKYETLIFHINDKDSLLKTFEGRPEWWNIHLKGDSIIRKTIRLSERNQQTLFFGKDSSHVFVCDRAT